MTTYAYLPTTGQVLALWPTGHGWTAQAVTGLADEETGRDLAATLTALSAAAWRTYTHPASSAGGDPENPNGEAWRRKAERDAFDDALTALTAPNLPHGGSLLVSYVAVLEHGHRVGRLLYALADDGVSTAVADEVRTDLGAVAAAELGDLSGRARQAVTLSRADVSPTQVQAAWTILEAGPLGAAGPLMTSLDPTAASVAAAAWLRAAAQVARETDDWTTVVSEADNIEALPVQTPTEVLEALEGGMSPTEVVLDLVSEAMAVAEGHTLDPETLLEQLLAAQRDTRHYVGQGLNVALRDLAPRLCTLDPARPARDLLEDLLEGIRGCFLLWQEDHWDLISTAAAGDPEDEDDEDAQESALRARAEALFTQQVRRAIAGSDAHS